MSRARMIPVEVTVMIPAAAYRACAQAAARGAKLLDKHRPGWFRRVKTTRLDMTASCSCVYGQLAAEGLLNEMASAGLAHDTSEWFGYMPPPLYGPIRDGLWVALQEEWLRQIRDRRQAAKASRA